MGGSLSRNTLTQQLLPDGSSIPAWLIHALVFFSDPDVYQVLQLNRNFCLFAKDDRFFKILCINLRHRGVYVPSALPHSERSWRSLYLELRPTAWSKSAVSTECMSDVDILKAVQSRQKVNTSRFRINVYARFRPFVENASNSSQDETENEVASGTVRCVLPLHQRLRLIRMSGAANTKREALRVLASEGDWFSNKWAAWEASHENARTIGIRDSESSLIEHESYNLLSNEKPLSFSRRTGQDRQGAVARVQTVDEAMARVVILSADVGLREFTFDGVVSGTPLGLAAANKQQEHCYSLFAKRLVVDFLNGFNGTCISYGQTAAGKTYTMIGAHDGATPGIVPRACIEVLQFLQDSQSAREKLGVHSTLSLSYIEIFGDLVCDLLKGGARVGHSKVAAQSFVLSGAIETPVCDLDDVYEALRVGDAQKRRAATAMNDRSSRAHSIVMLTLTQTQSSTGIVRKSRLFLADLGGSEKVQKSQVDAGQSRRRANSSDAAEGKDFSTGFELGTHMREAVNINLGLLALKRCVEALNLQQQNTYVPYQDSKLTMILSQGLGGNCKTSIVICGSMDPKHASETMATLRFGERCALVENDARSGASLLASVLKKLDSEIAHLEQEIQRKEKWVHQDVRRIDINAEAGTFEAQGMGGVETKKITFLSGAEAERSQLAELLARRRTFTGCEREPDKEVPRAMAFGKAAAAQYGIGVAFDEDLEAQRDNKRFHDALDETELSAVVRLRGAKNWTSTKDLEHDPRKLEELARKAPRSKLVYSGISA